MKQKGFSLIEVVGAMAILGLGIVASLTMFTFGNRDLIDRREETIALNLLRGKMEHLRAEMSVTTPAVTSEIDETCKSHGLNNCLLIIKEKKDSPATGLVKLDVTIQWNPVGQDSALRQRNLLALVGYGKP